MRVTELGAGVVRRETHLADGRELIYYDDPGTTLDPSRAPDLRDLEPRPDTPEMRRDPLTGDWVSIAAARQHRVMLPTSDRDPLAPQTPTNPSEIPANYDVAVFENRTPSFGPGLPEDPVSIPADASVRSSGGRCEVVAFSPAESGSFGSLSPTRARTVIEAWADRTAALSAIAGIHQVFPFENRGIEIGVTLPHPHGQIYGYPFVTPTTRRVLAHADASTFERLLDAERSGPRVVLAGEHWTAFVPYAARWPLEVHVLPHRHVADFTETSPTERDELAPLYLRLLRGIDGVYETPTPYIAAWMQAPVHSDRDRFRLHLQLTSPRRAADKFKFVAGSEAAMGAWISDVTPEAAADRLREAIATVPEVTE